MIKQCPNCGHDIVINGLGRKRLNLPLKNICEALRGTSNVDLASQKLGCSVGYIYKELAKYNLKPNDVIKRTQCFVEKSYK